MLRLSIYIAATSLLAAGCCCPAISGRYHEVGLPHPAHSANASMPAEPVTATSDKCEQSHGLFSNRHGHGGWLGRRQGGPVPSQQQFDYVSPLPKFHPAPTRPVFEPHEFYAPAVAMDRPPAAHGAPAGKP